MSETLFPSALIPWALASFALSFMICAIPFGLIIARLHGVDVRKVGSGNIGTTNVARSVGKGASALTLLLDAGKGALCVALARQFLPGFCGLAQGALEPFVPLGWVLSAVYLSCVLGHVFSPYLNFRGGKGIAVGLGGAIALHWPLALSILGVFIVVVVPTRYVSLASISASVSLTVIAALMGFSMPALVPIVVISALVVWAHRENIGRLMRHEERRFSFHREKE